MNKLFFISFISLSLLVSETTYANPLFADVVKIYVIGNLEYFYDSNGNVVVREDVGNAGYLYNNNGEAFACFSTSDDYFSNVGAYYYDLNGNYLGKVLVSSSNDFFTGDTIITRTYLDHKNRPVATFVEQSILGQLAEAGKAEDENDQGAYAAAIMGLLGGTMKVSKTYVLSGRIQRYRN